MAKQAPSSTIQHKGATYELVTLPKPTVTYKGAMYRLVSAEQLPEHVQEFLRQRSRNNVMDDLLSDIEHVSPHRRKSYDPSKVRMRGDEDQSRLEQLKVDISRMDAPAREEEPKVDTHVSPQEVEEIEFGEEQKKVAPQSFQEGPDPGELPVEEDLHVRVSGNDFSFLSSVPGMARDNAAAAFLNKVKQGKEKDRNEVWTSGRELQAVVKALENLIAGEDVGGDVKTNAEDLAARYRRMMDTPDRPRAPMPSYESKPRQESSNLRTFSYRGATIKRRVRR